MAATKLPNQESQNPNPNLHRRDLNKRHPLRLVIAHNAQGSMVRLHANLANASPPSGNSPAGPVEVEVSESGTRLAGAELHVRPAEEQASVDDQTQPNGQVPFRQGHNHAGDQDNGNHREPPAHSSPTHNDHPRPPEVKAASGHPEITSTSRLVAQSFSHSITPLVSGTQRHATPSASSILTPALETSSSSTTSGPISSSESSNASIAAFSAPATTTDATPSFTSSGLLAVPSNATDPSTTPVAISSALHTPPFYISIVIACVAAIALIAAVIAWAFRVRSAARRRRKERISARRLDSGGSGFLRNWWNAPFMNRGGSGRESLATVETSERREPHQPISQFAPQLNGGSLGNLDNGVRLDFPSELGIGGRLDVGGEFGMGSGTELTMRRTISSKRRHQRMDEEAGDVMEQAQYSRPRLPQPSHNSYTFPNPFEHQEQQQHQPGSVPCSSDPPEIPQPETQHSHLPRMDSFGLGVGLGLDLDLGRGLRVTNRAAGDGMSVTTSRSVRGDIPRAGTSMGVNDSSVGVSPNTSATYLNPTSKPITAAATDVSNLPTSSFPTLPSLPAMLNTIKTTFNAAFSPGAVAADEDKYTPAPTRLRKGAGGPEADDDMVVGDSDGDGNEDQPGIQPLSVNKRKYSRAEFGAQKNGLRSKSTKLGRRMTGLLTDTLKPNPASRGISRRSRSRMQRLKSSSRSTYRPDAGSDDILDYYATETSGRVDGERRPSFLTRNSSSDQSTSSQDSTASHNSYASQRSAASFVSDISTNSSKDEVMTDREREARDLMSVRSHARDIR